VLQILNTFLNIFLAERKIVRKYCTICISTPVYTGFNTNAHSYNSTTHGVGPDPAHTWIPHSPDVSRIWADTMLQSGTLVHPQSRITVVSIV